MKRYGEIAMAILEEIGDLALRSADGMVAMMTIGASSHIYAELNRRVEDIWREQDLRYDARYRRKILHQTVNRLKRGGMIISHPRAGFLLTSAGRKVLTRGFSAGSLSLRENYPSLATDRVVIVIFDIPDADRRKRDWFRRVLENMGFSLLQKSVWPGKRAISEELMHDLDAFSLLPYIHFFVVEQEGTLPLPAPDGAQTPS